MKTETALTESDLRTFAELCGWTKEILPGHDWRWHKPGCERKPAYCHCSSRFPFDSLEACVEGLEWFCGKRELVWSIQNPRPWYTDPTVYTVTIFASKGLWVSDNASVLQAAIIRAVIQAGKI